MKTTHPLRKWRADHKVGLEELAGRVGVNASHISLLERGLRSASLEVALKLVEVTGNVIPISAFSKGSAETEARNQ